MKTVASYESTSASLAYVCNDGEMLISLIRLLANGDLDDESELYRRGFNDPKAAAAMYVELEAMIKAADAYNYRLTSALVHVHAATIERKFGMSPSPRLMENGRGKRLSSARGMNLQGKCR